VLPVSLGDPARPLRRLLAIGCHADDVEIGCGATILSLIRSNPELHVTWVVLSGSDGRSDEAAASADAFLRDAGTSDVRLHRFRESFFPQQSEAIKETFETFKDVEPDLVLTHSRHDLHQDHALVASLTWNTFRDHAVLEYEIPKYDGDFGTPNVYVPLARDVVEEKIRLTCEHFVSQRDKHWFDEELLRSVMRVRGMECAAPYAEAFTSRKLALAT